MIHRDDSRLIFLSLEEATNLPSGSLFCYKEYWWIFDPKKGLVFYQGYGKRSIKTAAPQCNLNGVIAEQVRSRLYPWAELRQVPIVFHPQSPKIL